MGKRHHLGDMPQCHIGTRPASSAGHDKQTPLWEVDPLLDPQGFIDLNPSSTDQSFLWQSGLVNKLLLFWASILPLLAAIYLLVAKVTNRRSTEDLRAFVSTNRATAQIVVSLISAVLAGLNVYTITQLLNFATRIHLLQQSLTLTMLKFIEGVATRRFVSGLPVLMCTTSVIIILVFAIPNVLWTGALTPMLVNATILETGFLKIPHYSSSSNATWIQKEASGLTMQQPPSFM